MTEDEMMVFMVRSMWLDLGISETKREKAIKRYFDVEGEITNREDAINILLVALDRINNRMLKSIQIKGTYSMLMSLIAILNWVMEYYLAEKKSRTAMAIENIRETELLDAFMVNRNIERHIIDACNIWIENSILHQTKLEEIHSIPKEAFNLDHNLLLDMYIYGFASQALSLLRLSRDLDENTFYGISITPTVDIALNIIKKHPVVYYNPVIGGNQSNLLEADRIKSAEHFVVSDGFEQENHISFSMFLGVLKYVQTVILENNPDAIVLYKKGDLIEQINELEPPIDGKLFLACASINKNSIKGQLMENENTIWKIGTNKYRLEIRPFIELEDANIVISYAACTQSMQIWYSYCMNGGNCYRSVGNTDRLQKALEQRNRELASILLEKIRAILRRNYKPTIDYINVDYQRIFGSQPIDYGDYDIVFYSAKEKELYLIESKYISDSLNVSGLINDYKKMFSEGGYYKHCRARYDLVLNNSTDMKRFIGVDPDENIRAHLLFVSSKPLEIEFQDKEGIVTFLSLNNLEGFIKGKLISEDGSTKIRPEVII